MSLERLTSADGPVCMIMSPTRCARLRGAALQPLVCSCIVSQEFLKACINGFVKFQLSFLNIRI